MSSINVCMARQKEGEALMEKGIQDTCVGVLNVCKEEKKLPLILQDEENTLFP